MNSTNEQLTRSREFNQKIIVLAAFSFITNELIAKTSAGVYFSLSLFLFASIYITLRPKHAFAMCFALSFLIQEFPRDILLDYTNYVFETIRTVKVGPAALFLYLSLLVLLQGIFRAASLGSLTLIILINTSIIAATFVKFLTLQQFNAGLAANNYKIIIFTSIGILFGREYLSRYGRQEAIEKFMSLLVLCALATSVRAMLNLGLEIYHSNIFVFELGTEPLYLFAAMLYTMQRDWPAYSYLGFFTTSRAEIVFLVFATISLNINRLRKLRVLGTLKIATFLITSYFVVLETIPFIIDFFLWKVREIEIFGGPASGSSIIRQHEILNILCAMKDNPIKFLLGSGLNATYNFDCIPLPSSVELEEKSFSYDQIMSNSFYGVHSTPAALLLRFGVLGAILTATMATAALIYVFKRSGPTKRKIALALTIIFSLYYFHSQTHAQMALGFLISCIVMREKAVSNSATPSTAQHNALV